MANTATITAYSGPGIAATAIVLTDVTQINFDLDAGVLFVNQGGNEKVNQFELTGSNTITLTASGGSYTLTVT